MLQLSNLHVSLSLFLISSLQSKVTPSRGGSGMGQSTGMKAVKINIYVHLLLPNYAYFYVL